jgi:hypothetical protein
MEGKLAGGRMIVKAKDVVAVPLCLQNSCLTRPALGRLGCVADFKNFHCSLINEQHAALDDGTRLQGGTS